MSSTRNNDAAQAISPRYSATSRHLHWLMAPLVVLAYVLIISRGWFEKGSDLRLFVVQGHFWVGIAVFALVLPRLLARFANPTPAIVPPLNPLTHAASKITHTALYAFLLLQPLMGMLVVFLERGGIPLGGLMLPSPFEMNQHLAHRIEDLHITVGTAFYYVIALHIAAVLWHHFARRDNVLKRML